MPNTTGFAGLVDPGVTRQQVVLAELVDLARRTAYEYSPRERSESQLTDFAATSPASRRVSALLQAGQMRRTHVARKIQRHWRMRQGSREVTVDSIALESEDVESRSPRSYLVTGSPTMEKSTVDVRMVDSRNSEAAVDRTADSFVDVRTSMVSADGVFPASFRDVASPPLKHVQRANSHGGPPRKVATEARAAELERALEVSEKKRLLLEEALRVQGQIVTEVERKASDDVRAVVAPLRDLVVKAVFARSILDRGPFFYESLSQELNELHASLEGLVDRLGSHSDVDAAVGNVQFEA